MKTFDQSVSLRDVLPSAVTITLLGLALCSVMTTPWHLLGPLGWWSVPAGALLGSLMYAGAFVLTCSPQFYTRSMRELMSILHTLFQRFSWFDIILISMLAGLGEELLVRGALQTWLIELSNPAIGIALASVVFGLMHFLRPIYVLVTIVLGAVFGLAIYVTQSIVLVIVAHTVYDIFAFFIIVKRPHLIGINSGNATELPIREDDQYR